MFLATARAVAKSAGDPLNDIARPMGAGLLEPYTRL